MASGPSAVRTLGVTGATGCIGGMLLRHLSDEPSQRVIALIRPEAGSVGHQVEVRRGDLFTRDALEGLVADSDVILHLAARNPSSPAQDKRNVAGFFATNSWGTAALVHLARTHDKPLIYTSSVAVYELGGSGSGSIKEQENLPAREKTKAWFQKTLSGLGRIVDAWVDGEVKDPRRRVAALLRDDPPPPENIYGLSKLLGERWVAQMAEGLVLRLSDVYGPGHETRGILQGYLDGVLEGTPVIVDFGPRERVSFVYLRDVLRALLRSVMKARALAGSVINVANPASLTAEQLRDTLLTLGGRGPVTVRDLQRSHLVGSARPFATGRAEQLLETTWTPLPEGMRETLQYRGLPPRERDAYRFSDLGV